MTIVIRITGKARQIFKLISLLTIYRGEDTIGEIIKDKEKCNIPVMQRELI